MKLHHYNTGINPETTSKRHIKARESEPPRKYRLSEQQVIAEMEAAGFGLVERFDFLPREYFLIF